MNITRVLDLTFNPFLRRLHWRAVTGGCDQPRTTYPDACGGVVDYEGFHEESG